MIDTDKYEGHDEEEWVITCDDGITWNIHTVSDKHLVECKLHNTVTNFVLMRDAPLLLEEVKRLREGIEHALTLSRDNNERVDKLRELIE